MCIPLAVDTPWLNVLKARAAPLISIQNNMEQIKTKYAVVVLCMSYVFYVCINKSYYN